MPESTQNPAMFFHHQIFETVKDKINNQLKVRLGVVKKLIEIASFSKCLGHLDTSLIHQPQDCINLLQNSIEKARVPLLHLQGMGHVPVGRLHFPSDSVQITNFFVFEPTSLQICCKQCRLSCSGVDQFDQMDQGPFKFKTQVSL